MRRDPARGGTATYGWIWLEWHGALALLTPSLDEIAGRTRQVLLEAVAARLLKEA